MPASEDELNYARSYIGTIETEDVFNERVDRLSDFYDERSDVINAAIEESMRAQLHSMMLDQPGQASVGSVSYSNGANIQTMANELQDFQKSSGIGLVPLGSTKLTMARLVRQRER